MATSTRDPRLRTLVPLLEKLPKSQLDNLVSFLDSLLQAQAIVERYRSEKIGRPEGAAKGKRVPRKR